MKELHFVTRRGNYYNPLSNTQKRINWMKSVFKDQQAIVDIKNSLIVGVSFTCKGEIVKQFLNDCLI